MAPTRAVTLIPGDGIGPEVMDATVRVLEAIGAPFTYERHEAGADTFAKHDTNLPQATLDSVLANRVALKGPTATAIGKGPASANVALRKSLDLYASLRPVKSILNVKTRYENVDLIVVRENSEDLYMGMENMIVPGVAQSLKIITEKGSTRIARFAFELARKEMRRKVSAIHKANIMKVSDGLFLDCCRKVAKDYPEIEFEDLIVDNLCMQLVRDPSKYDVLLTENLYGDILSDLCAGLVGGLGIVPGGNIGEKCAVFEAVHGTAPDIAGKGIANPTALLMSAAMMLRWMELEAMGGRLERALLKIYAEGKVRTGDLGGKATTAQFTQAVIDTLD